MGFGSGSGSTSVPANAFRDLFADCLDRVQRRHRFLENHADVVAAQRAHLVLGGGKDIDATEGNPAGGAGGKRQQTHDGKRRHRLARAAFADKPHHFALVDGQVDALEDRRAVDIDREVFYFKQAQR